MNEPETGLFPEPPYAADALFGDAGGFSYAEKFFLPFWRAVEEPFVSDLGEKRRFFLPGALSDFRREFLSFASVYWQSLFKSVLSDDPELEGVRDPKRYTELSDRAVQSGRLYREVRRRYPGIDGMIRELIRDTLMNLTEVCGLLADRDREIREFYFDGAPFSPVARISDGIADRHNHGRAVHIVTYENEHKLVLKPHDMAVDRAFAGFTDDLCRLIGAEPLRHIRSRESETWCTCEFIRRRELRGPADAGTFYFRVGILMAAVWLLGGNDIHSENLIACGDQPVLVDTETVLYAATPYDALFPPYDFSLASVGFLPYLGPAPGLHPGCDSLTTAPEGSLNLPYSGGTEFRGSDFVPELTRGFSAVLNACMSHRAEVSASLRKHMTGAEVRRLLRPTRFYAAMLRVLTERKALASREETAALKQLLYRRLDRVHHAEAADRLADAEFAALLSLDVPEFRVPVREPDLCRIEARIDSLDPEQIRNLTGEIRFLLEPTRADAPGPERAGTGRGAACLAGYARRLLPALSEQRGILTLRDGYRRYICRPITTMMEGAMGAAVALAAVSRILPEFSEDVRRFADRMIADDGLWTPGISVQEPGFSEGTGGFLFGAAVLAEYGFLPREFLDQVAEKDRSVLGDRALAPDPSLFYGTAGLEIGRKRLEYARSPRGMPPRAALPRNPGTPGNYTLAFGLAGDLVRATRRRIAEKKASPSKEETELFNRLTGCGSPPRVSGLAAPGLLFGESGRLYALAFSADPSAVSALFE